jgi:hypothetical protein
MADCPMRQREAGGPESPAPRRISGWKPDKEIAMSDLKTALRQAGLKDLPELGANLTLSWCWFCEYGCWNDCYSGCMMYCEMGSILGFE